MGNKKEGKTTIICGVSVPREVVAASKNLGFKIYFGFMKINDSIIKERLTQRGWNKQLVQDNSNWAHHLEHEVILQENHKVIDCSINLPEQIADEFITWIMIQNNDFCGGRKQDDC